ncbi:hypothetical protein C7449_103508 [Mycoplana dimorpha]|uniref:Uncharacterized protein n=1 Tax=Mycoplana dimorpha TaxID=28320 RepID=A0A2T5BBY8_MYCDI|nr:hypothetical protein C7449_103508 [Mycoplana dimorpha]
MTQPNPFDWAEAKSDDVIDVMPALFRKAAMEAICNIRRPKGGLRRHQL